MNGCPILYVDQYGTLWPARSVRELRRRLGGGRISKMYVDRLDGSAVHIGYVIGSHWCTAFARVTWPA